MLAASKERKQENGWGGLLLFFWRQIFPVGRIFTNIKAILPDLSFNEKQKKMATMLWDQLRNVTCTTSDNLTTVECDGMPFMREHSHYLKPGSAQFFVNIGERPVRPLSVNTLVERLFLCFIALLDEVLVALVLRPFTPLLFHHALDSGICAALVTFAGGLWACFCSSLDQLRIFLALLPQLPRVCSSLSVPFYLMMRYCCAVGTGRCVQWAHAGPAEP